MPSYSYLTFFILYCTCFYFFLSSTFVSISEYFSSISIFIFYICLSRPLLNYKLAVLSFFLILPLLLYYSIFSYFTIRCNILLSSFTVVSQEVTVVKIISRRSSGKLDGCKMAAHTLDWPYTMGSQTGWKQLHTHKRLK